MPTKSTMTSQAVYGKTQDRYLALVRRFPLRPLRTDADLDAAVAVIDELIDRPKLTPPERDYLDVLADLVEAFEAEAVPIAPVGDAELLRFLIEQKNVTQAAVATGAGIAESTISEVLAGKRKLNRTQIGKLGRFFHVEPGIFLADSSHEEHEGTTIGRATFDNIEDALRFVVKGLIPRRRRYIVNVRGPKEIAKAHNSTVQLVAEDMVFNNGEPGLTIDLPFDPSSGKFRHLAEFLNTDLAALCHAYKYDKIPCFALRTGVDILMAEKALRFLLLRVHGYRNLTGFQCEVSDEGPISRKKRS